MRQATITGQAMKITIPATPTEPEVSTLIVTITIDCPDCGTHTAQYAGHHLRSIRDLLIQWIDEFPELCGQEGGIAVAQRLKFGGTAPADPSTN